MWILKNYTIKELKSKASRALNKPDVNVGDIVILENENKEKAVVLEIVGSKKDVITVIFKDVRYRSFVVQEGVYVYDVKPTGKNVDIRTFLEVINR